MAPPKLPVVSFATSIVLSGALAAATCFADDPQPPTNPGAAAIVPPIGDQHVTAVRLLPIPRTHSGRAQAVRAAADGIYLAGKAYHREDKSSLWLWKLDLAGNNLWEQRLPMHTGEPGFNSGPEIIGLLPGFKRSGVTVISRQGIGTWRAQYKTNGELRIERSLGLLETTHGLVEVDDDCALLFGYARSFRGKRPCAWVASMNQAGAVLWKHTFRTGAARWEGLPLDAEGQPQAVEGAYPECALFDGAVLADGSLMFLGQTGLKNKFGQGPSKLWLLHLDSDGEKLGETFVDGGHILPASPDLITPCGDGVLVPYATRQLPPIANAPSARHPGSPIRLARFDAQLDKLWDKPITTTFMPGAVSLTGAAPYVCVTPWPDDLQIRGVNEDGEEMWIAQVATPDSWVMPLATLRTADELLVLCNYRVQGLNDFDQQVLLLQVAPPRGNDP